MNSHLKASMATAIIISIIGGIVWLGFIYPNIAGLALIVIVLGGLLVAILVIAYQSFYEKYEKSRERNKRNQGGGASGW